MWEDTGVSLAWGGGVAPPRPTGKFGAVRLSTSAKTFFSRPRHFFPRWVCGPAVRARNFTNKREGKIPFFFLSFSFLCWGRRCV